MSWSIDSIPSYCITLERRPDRWRRFQDQSGINGLDLKKFNGVDGKTLDIKNDERVSIYTKRNILSKSRRSHEELDSAGGVGCALSHIAIWQWMVDNNQEVCLIFEDDAIIPPDFTNKVNKYNHKLECTHFRKFLAGCTAQGFRLWLLQWAAGRTSHLERCAKSR